MKKMLVVVMVVFSVLLINGATISKSMIVNYAATSDSMSTVDNGSTSAIDLEKQADPYNGNPFIRNEDSGND
jgi:hypothetical protein